MKVFKKTIAVLLATVMCLSVLSVAVSAEDSVRTEGNYTYTVENGTAKITGFKKNYIGDLSIPEALGGYTVTAIGEKAFAECKRVKSIVIPDCVTTIGASAFEGCVRAKTLTVGKGVVNVGAGAFNSLLCMRKIYFNAESCRSLSATPFAELGVSKDGVEVYFGDSVRSIPSYLFGRILERETINTAAIFGKDVDLGSLFGSSLKFDVKTLKIVKVVIGKNVESIGAYAFANCSKIQSVYFTDSIKSIGTDAFSCGTAFEKLYESSTSYASGTMGVYDTTHAPTKPEMSTGEALIIGPLLGLGAAFLPAIVIGLLPLAPMIKVIDYFEFISKYVIV